MTTETKEIVVRPVEGILSARDVQARVNVIQEVMRNVMEVDVHYGKIPGCPKPSLYKAGAEKIAMTFQMNVDCSGVEDLSTADEKRFRVTAVAYSVNEVKLGSAPGECSSNEEKYKWRAPKCEAEYEATPSDRKRIKWDQQGNETKQIRTEHADLANTILQMAAKRAYVAVVRAVTAASDIFTQDIEDLDNVPQNGEAKPAAQKPKPKASALNPADFRPFKSKFKGTCKGCGKGFDVSADILYSKALGTYHPACIKPAEDAPEPSPAASTITPQILKNLETMAKAAKQTLLDRIGRDGLEALDQITPEYAQELMTEFAGIMDGNAK